MSFLSLNNKCWETITDISDIVNNITWYMKIMKTNTTAVMNVVVDHSCKEDHAQ